MFTIKVFGCADGRSYVEKVEYPDSIEPMVFIIGNRQNDFDIETLTLSPRDARLVAMAMINAAELAESGRDYDKVIDSDYEDDSNA